MKFASTDGRRDSLFPESSANTSHGLRLEERQPFERFRPLCHRSSPQIHPAIHPDQPRLAKYRQHFFGLVENQRFHSILHAPNLTVTVRHRRGNQSVLIQTREKPANTFLRTSSAPRRRLQTEDSPGFEQRLPSQQKLAVA